MSEPALLPETEFKLSLIDECSGKYLIFRLADGEFGVPIRKVREVMELQEITAVPNAPAFIAGVINLRGKVIPVVDLRLSFGLHSEASTPHSCIVVVRVTLAGSEQILGILVDSITDVLQIQPEDFLLPEDFQIASEFTTRDPAPYLLGIARIGGEVKLLLDIDEVLNNLDPRSEPALSAAA